MKTAKGTRRQQAQRAIDFSVEASSGDDFSSVYLVEERVTGKRHLYFEQGKEPRSIFAQHEDVFLIGEVCRRVLNDFERILEKGQALMAA